MVFVFAILIGFIANVYAVSRGFMDVCGALEYSVFALTILFVVFIIPTCLFMRHCAKSSIAFHEEMFSKYYLDEYATIKDLEWFKRVYEHYENEDYKGRRWSYIVFFPFMPKPEKYVLEEFPNDYYDRLADAAREEKQ